MAGDERQDGAFGVLRRARGVEAAALADLLWRVRHENEPSIPAMVHDRDDVGRWMQDVVLAQYDVWVADRSGAVVGLLVLGRPDWIEHLYIDAVATGQGLGGRFIELAKRVLPEQIQLWTFQSNTGACRFYERHGFKAVQWTEGDNEEGAPDVRYVYTP